MRALTTRLTAGYQAIARHDLAVALTGYLVLALIFGYRLRDVLNVDGVSYSRLARYLAEGNFELGVVSYWSPLLPWSMAPLVAAGMDALHAARIVLAIAGGLTIIAVALLLRRRTSLPAGWRLPVLVLVAVGAVAWTTRMIRPDSMLAAGLLFFLLVVSSPRVLESKRVALAAGACGGLAALAKAYGLPFLLVQLPLSLLLLAWPRRREPGLRRRLAVAILMGLVGTALVVGPWMGILSARYGRGTWTSVGAIAHAVMSPSAPPRYHPIFQTLQPPAGRVTVWEVPETLDYDFWSPFDGRRELAHQVDIITGNLGRLVRAFREFDALGVCMAALLVVPLVTWRKQRGFEVLWVWSTMVVFAAGFMPLFFRPFYVVPFLWPLCVAYLFVFIQRAFAGVSSRLAVVVCLAVAGSLICVPIWRLEDTTSWQTHQNHRAFARHLAEVGAEGPVAVGSGRILSDGMYIAYHLDSPYLHVIRDSSPSAVAESLADWGVGTYILDTKLRLSRVFEGQDGWRLIGSARLGNRRVKAFAAPLSTEGATGEGPDDR